LPPIALTGTVPGAEGGSGIEFSADILNQDDYNSNNQAQIDVPVIRAPTDLIATVSDGGVPFVIGGEASDTVTVRNVGSQAYAEPVQLQYVMYGGNPVPSGSGWTCDEVARLCTSAESVPAGGTLPSLTFTSDIPIDSTQLESEFVVSIINSDDGYSQNNAGVRLDTPIVSGSPLRYVAFGDSVPYGHGLANPGNETHSNLPPDQGPSPLAYPSLVAKALHLSMNVRTDNCLLTGDQLAVSGAPAAAADVVGADADCNSAVPHPAVDPTELDAAHLSADPPYVATIQAGADDFDFVACLMRDLTIVLGNTCVVNGQPTETVQIALTNAKVALIALIDQLQAVGTKKIALLNFYQPIPPPNRISARARRTDPVCGLLYNNAVKTYSDASVLLTALNTMIASVASTTGVQLINTSTVFAGHEMCTGTPYVFAASLDRTPEWRTAHPTQTGQAKIAQLVEAALRKP